METSLPLPAQLAWEDISATHPDYDGFYLERLRAFYKGGRALLRNDRLMAEVFPKHRDEAGNVYQERKRRAFYLPYAGEIVGFIAASLSADRISIGLPSEGGDKLAQPEIPVWYADWFKDVSPKGGKCISMHDFVKSALLEGMICRQAWALVDMPKGNPDYQNLQEQEKAGALGAWAILLPAETIIDWDEDESGELQFVVTHTKAHRRGSLDGGRKMVTERFCVYTTARWAVYELTHECGKKPDPKDMVPRVAVGEHRFGRVQIVRLDVGDGLWAMDNIESPCRALFESLSSRAWAEFQSLHQELYEFLGPEDAPRGAVIGQNQTDTNRAKKQQRGQGHVQERGQDDRAEFIGPSNAPFEEARKSCGELRAEIHRVTHQMALAADNSAAALRRSADSKGQDKASAVVVFNALGQIGRRFAEELTSMVSRGRGDGTYVEKWAASGMGKFDAISLDAELERQLTISQLTIPSPTFHKLNAIAWIREKLGDDASPDELEQIRDELEKGISEDNMPGPPRNGLPGLPEVTDDEETLPDETPAKEKAPAAKNPGKEKAAVRMAKRAAERKAKA